MMLKKSEFEFVLVCLDAIIDERLKAIFDKLEPLRDAEGHAPYSGWASSILEGLLEYRKHILETSAAEYAEGALLGGDPDKAEEMYCAFVGEYKRKPLKDIYSGYYICAGDEEAVWPGPSRDS